MKTLVAYFNLSKWEAYAALILCFIGAVLFALSNFIPKLFSVNNIYKNDQVILDSFIAEVRAAESDTNFKKQYQNKQYNKSDGSNIHAFAFEPATLDSAGWLRLGLNPKQVATILNYRNKGGQFRSKEDVQKMYSISEAEFEKLEPFIIIRSEDKRKEFIPYVKKEKEKLHIELNTADTATLNKLYGIGATLAYRIVSYREQIGGFVQTKQIKEVYGITDSTFQKIENEIWVNKAAFKPIIINAVSFQQLSAHPYFKETLALAILKLRKQNNGRIEQWDQIASLPEITPEIATRIRPYLSFK